MNTHLLDTKYRYLVAVSGGPDSMALLDMLVKADYQVEVAHINYHLRDTSDRDQLIVEEYCNRRNIPLHIYHVSEKPHGNLQNWARHIRYRFFTEKTNQFGLKGVITAHHQDDCVESYFMQVKKGVLPDYWGISERSIYEDIPVIRPLLKYRKNQLLDYCHKYDIKYGIDESNSKLIYERNRIRSKISQISSGRFDDILSEIEARNSELNREHSAADLFVEKYPLENGINRIDFMKLTDVSKILVLRKFLRVTNGPKKYYRMIFLNRLKGWIESSHPTSLFGTRNFTFINNHDSIQFVALNADHPITKTLDIDEDLVLSDWRFSWSESPNAYRIYVNESDFPLTIELPYQAGSRILTRNGHKKVARVMIDAKVPRHLRSHIPVVKNSSGLTIGIVGFYTQARLNHMQRTLFVLK